MSAGKSSLAFSRTLAISTVALLAGGVAGQYGSTVLADAPTAIVVAQGDARTVETSAPPISEEVRTALAKAVAARTSPSLTFRHAEDAHRWSMEMQERLSADVQEQARRGQILQAVHYYALRVAIDPQLVLALIDVQSGFKFYAVSPAGAMGLMQIMPFWVKVIGRPGDQLFDTRTNIVYGCAILRHYLDIENGDHRRALARYHGGVDGKAFADRVHRAWRGRWAFDGPTS